MLCYWISGWTGIAINTDDCRVHHANENHNESTMFGQILTIHYVHFINITIFQHIFWSNRLCRAITMHHYQIRSRSYPFHTNDRKGVTKQFCLMPIYISKLKLHKPCMSINLLSSNQWKCGWLQCYSSSFNSYESRWDLKMVFNWKNWPVTFHASFSCILICLNKLTLYWIHNTY